MKIYKHRTLIIVCTLAALGSAPVAMAQEATPDKPATQTQRVVVVDRSTTEVNAPLPAMPPMMPMPMIGGVSSDFTFSFVSGELSFDRKLIKNSPYSADAVTETVQTLGDGNRITHKTTASVYRDSEGRTCRDQTLGMIGQWAAAGDPPQTIFINDPVAQVNYILDPRTHTARKLALPRLIGKYDTGSDKKFVSLPAPPAPGAKGIVVSSGVDLALPSTVEILAQATQEPVKPQTESLGKQMIEGVEAEGTRTRLTIPAGQIGNELPIEIVSERWYAPSLGVVVMTRHSDPRSGETIYRLTNINRSEPAHSLFEVPSDYKLVNMDEKVRVMKYAPADSTNKQ